ncbi:MAG: flavoprotein [Candidatus Omnitrophica bacterium]|nr:flavoprotein [Candidatus Omnitrophota bacterium]
MSKKEIVIGVTGGISAYKTCEIVRYLKKNDFGVTVLMSTEAAEFIGPLTFRTLSGRPVVMDMFAENIVWDPCHIALAEKADCIVVVPATAHSIAKLAVGLCDDIISCVITASKAPVIICPAMNDNMYNHPAVQANLKMLKKFGYTIIGPVKGRLASGKCAVGHLADIAEITRAIEKTLR